MLHGIFTGAHAHMIQRVSLGVSKILLAHPRERYEQAFFFSRHVTFFRFV